MEKIGSVLWRAECVIAKSYKLTHSTDKCRSCLDKLDRNEKLFLAAEQIVS